MPNKHHWFYYWFTFPIRLTVGIKNYQEFRFIVMEEWVEENED